MEYVNIKDFERLDLRVGHVVKAERIPGKDRVMKVYVDVGGEVREIVVGGAQFYTPEDMVGKTVVVLANLEPKVVAGVLSRGMLLAADVDGKPYWLTVEGDVKPGVRVR